MYALYREVTNHIGNEYRNAWLRAETKPVLEKKLHARYELAVKTYKWNIGFTLRWTFPSVVVALVGLVVAVRALHRLRTRLPSLR